jgi:transposase-like protein
MKKRGRRGFDEQFRREAVRLAESGTMPIAEVARQLGVHLETLRNWRRKRETLAAWSP